MSLIHLDESLKVFNLPSGNSILLDRGAIRRRVMKAGKEVKVRYNTMKKRADFCQLSFMVENNLPLDKICGVFPMVFADYRRVSHSLRMAWAFYLTMRMKKMEKVAFNQRTKDKVFRPKAKNLLTVLFVHIYSQLQSLGITEEKSIIKCLKNSLCYHVSESLSQDELPDGPHFNMIPFELRGFFAKLDLEARVNFHFSLLQSKSLCKEVPEAFVQDSLVEHREKLSTPTPPMSQASLETLRERGRSFGRKVVKYYNPNRGFYPINKATFAFLRSDG
jgi:hypothetical protein